MCLKQAAREGKSLVCSGERQHGKWAGDVLKGATVPEDAIRRCVVSTNKFVGGVGGPGSGRGR